MGRVLSTKGKQYIDSAWVANEYDALVRANEAGANVPQPLALGSNALLMEFLGDSSHPAPELSVVSIEPVVAGEFFERLVEAVGLFLSRDLIHGDLSANNILCCDQGLKVIDFPQALDAVSNPNAFPLLVRDLERICEFFTKYGIEASALNLAQEMWRLYQRGEL